MALSERVGRSRAESLAAIPTVSTERVELVTEFYVSDYFCDLGRALQEKIIARTEQIAF